MNEVNAVNANGTRAAARGDGAAMVMVMVYGVLGVMDGGYGCVLGVYDGMGGCEVSLS